MSLRVDGCFDFWHTHAVSITTESWVTEYEFTDEPWWFSLSELSILHNAHFQQFPVIKVEGQTATQLSVFACFCWRIIKPWSGTVPIKFHLRWSINSTKIWLSPAFFDQHLKPTIPRDTRLVPELPRTPDMNSSWAPKSWPAPAATGTLLTQPREKVHGTGPSAPWRCFYFWGNSVAEMGKRCFWKRILELESCKSTNNHAWHEMRWSKTHHEAPFLVNEVTLHIPSCGSWRTCDLCIRLAGSRNRGDSSMPIWQKTQIHGTCIGCKWPQLTPVRLMDYHFQ